MEIRNRKKSNSKLIIGLSGLSSSGKTYSSLLLADGLVGLDNTVVIDTERSIDLYSKIGTFKVLDLYDDFSPETYIKAIHKAHESGASCIVVDSLTHVWTYLLNEHTLKTGNKFTNWRKLVPRYQSLIYTLVQLDCHLIVTLRSKEKYRVVEDRYNKPVPQKIGIKPIIRKGFEYECSLFFDLDVQHKATCLKDRTEVIGIGSTLYIEKRTGGY